MTSKWTVPHAPAGFVELGVAVESQGATLEQVAAASPLATKQLRALFDQLTQKEEELKAARAQLTGMIYQVLR